jgi:predicted nucleic acid-binding protein
MGETEGTMKPKVYVETTILSYLVARPSRDVVTAARQLITRRWWERYSLVVSEAVEAECERGDPEMVKRRRELPKVSLFPVDQRILEVAKLLVAPGAIPTKAGPDAIHTAAAAVEGRDFLLTWNFRHIANVQIRRQVERILANHGYTKTTIYTPEELV